MLHLFFRTMDDNIRDLDCESLTSLLEHGLYPKTNFCYGKTLRSYFALRKFT